MLIFSTRMYVFLSQFTLRPIDVRMFFFSTRMHVFLSQFFQIATLSPFFSCHCDFIVSNINSKAHQNMMIWIRILLAFLLFQPGHATLAESASADDGRLLERTLYDVQYVGRFQYILGSCCRGFLANVHAQCGGELTIEKTSSDTIQCTQLDPSSARCSNSCTDRDSCEEVFINDNFGEVYFNCQGERLDDTKAFFTYEQDEESSSCDSCSVSAWGSQFHYAELGVRCPNDPNTFGVSGDYSFNHRYFECNADTESLNLGEGRYTCSSGRNCGRSGCTFTYDPVIVTASLEAFSDECFQTITDDGTPETLKPTLAPSFGLSTPSATFNAEYIANWELRLDNSCTQALPKIRARCNDGGLLLNVEKRSSSIKCTTISTSEIECQETSSGRLESFIRYECEGISEEQMLTKFEYVEQPYECSQSEDRPGFHILQLGVSCGGRGAGNFNYDEVNTECSVEDGFDDVDDKFSCFQAASECVDNGNPLDNSCSGIFPQVDMFSTKLKEGCFLFDPHVPTIAPSETPTGIPTISPSSQPTLTPQPSISPAPTRFERGATRFRAEIGDQCSTITITCEGGAEQLLLEGSSTDNIQCTYPEREQMSCQIGGDRTAIEFVCVGNKGTLSTTSSGCDQQNVRLAPLCGPDGCMASDDTFDPEQCSIDLTDIRALSAEYKLDFVGSTDCDRDLRARASCGGSGFIVPTDKNFRCDYTSRSVTCEGKFSFSGDTTFSCFGNSVQDVLATASLPSYSALCDRILGSRTSGTPPFSTTYVTRGGDVQNRLGFGARCDGFFNRVVAGPQNDQCDIEAPITAGAISCLVQLPGVSTVSPNAFGDECILRGISTTVGASPLSACGATPPMASPPSPPLSSGNDGGNTPSAPSSTNGGGGANTPTGSTSGGGNTPSAPSSTNGGGGVNTPTGSTSGTIDTGGHRSPFTKCLILLVGLFEVFWL